MQAVALVFTIAIVEIAISNYPKADLGTVLLGIPLAAVGSYIAPVTRDLIAALEKLRA